MAVVEELFRFLVLMLSFFGTLALAGIGLAIIFGIMGIINFAHGEFIMIGAYSTSMAYQFGLPLIAAIGVGGLATGVFGLVVERLLIRHMYDRLIDTLVATWGLSLILTQVVRIQFGGSFAGVPVPFGTFQYGGFSASMYKIVLGFAAIALFALAYVILMYTDYGLQARAAMQNKDMARSLGVQTDRVYMLTFFFGSVLSGVAGGLFAPLTVLTPSMGSDYIVKAFVTVIVGGANVIVGTSGAALSLGFIQTPASQIFGTLGGRVALLVTTILIIRILPEGISGVVTRD
ncbi:branched-chain amino acid ABC transporter permease [Haloplanus sp. GCM10025708]|uniref:ABC transporter permease subunit n=1 Tax=Haloferacaceae TaxID=1644056 RepID=UPI003621CC58